MKKEKILLVYPISSTFVVRDYEILSSEYCVDKHEIQFPSFSLKSLLLIVKEIFFFLFRIFNYKAIVIWFGDYHSFFPTMFAKLWRVKTYLIVGGYDVASMPEISYGSFSKPIRAFCTRCSYKWATLCLPVVEALDEKLKKFVPSAKSEVVYTGFKEDEFKPASEPKEKMVLTIAQTRTRSRYLLKGLDRFVLLAKNTPEFTFILVGLNEEYQYLIDDKPDNLIVIGGLPFLKLVDYMRRSSFYAQLSLSEGLPSTICETMLCECIPIGTNVGGIKNAIGDCGLVADWNIELFKNYILTNHDNIKLRKKARDYIKTHYYYSRRKDKILSLIS